MAAESTMGRRELEEKIVALAWKDEDFRRKFLADPKGQFEARLGQKLPANLKMTAHAEDENHLHFVIPAKPAGMDVGELSDADLEKVAGGVDVLISLGAVYATVSVAAAVSAVVEIGKKEGAW